MGVKVSKRYSLYKSQPNSFKFVLDFLAIVLTKLRWEVLKIFSFRFFTILFSKISNSPFYRMGKLKTSVV